MVNYMVVPPYVYTVDTHYTLYSRTVHVFGVIKLEEKQM